MEFSLQRQNSRTFFAPEIVSAGGPRGPGHGNPQTEYRGQSFPGGVAYLSREVRTPLDFITLRD